VFSTSNPSGLKDLERVSELLQKVSESRQFPFEHISESTWNLLEEIWENR
jgi:hypothetical protein